MNIQEIKQALWRIAKPYPRLQGILQREVGQTSQGAVWATLIADAKIDASHFDDICDEFESLRRPLPDPLDNLIQEIVQEAKDRAYRDQQKWEQHQKHHAPKPGECFAIVRGWKSHRVALRLAKMKAAREITAEQNDQMLDEMFAAERGEIETPHWLQELSDENLQQVVSQVDDRLPANRRADEPLQIGSVGSDGPSQ